MRVAVLTLVLVNVALFAWLRWAGDSVPQRALKPAAQAGERLVLSSDPGFAEPAPPPPATGGRPAGEALSGTGVRPMPHCMTWGPLSASAARRLVARFDRAPSPLEELSYTTRVVAAYRVELGGFPDVASARRAGARIRQGGIEDLLLLPGQAGRPPTLSLGVFNRHDHARRRAEAVRALGFDPEIRAIEGRRRLHYLWIRQPVPQSVAAAIAAAGVKRGPFRSQCSVRPGNVQR